MASKIIPDWYMITVGEGTREALMRALRVPANREVFAEVGPSGYTDGSTAWAVVVRSPSTPQRQRDVLWQSGLGAQAWCTVRPLTEQEQENLL